MAKQWKKNTKAIKGYLINVVKYSAMCGECLVYIFYTPKLISLCEKIETIFYLFF